MHRCRALEAVREEGAQNCRGLVIASHRNEALTGIARRQKAVLITQPTRASAGVHHGYDCRQVDRVTAEPGQGSMRARASTEYHHLVAVAANREWGPGHTSAACGVCTTSARLDRGSGLGSMRN